MAETGQSKKPEYPEEGEYVIGTVKSVFPYGAFVKLQEFPGKEGMIHISEISHKWVKNIKDHVKEGDRIVTKVLKIDLERGHIDLSLKSVKTIQKKQKLDEYQQEGRAVKLIDLAANRLDDKESIEDVTKKLNTKFGSLYSAFEAAVATDETVFDDVDIQAKWKKELAKIAAEHIQKPKVEIKTMLELTSSATDGIEIIKGAITDAKKACVMDDVEVDVKYQGAPKYKVVVTAPDYKIAEKCLGKFTEEVTSTIGSKGEATFTREKA